MSQFPNTNINNTFAAPAAPTPGQQAFGSNNVLNELQIDDFLNLIIAELQNQDPLNPLENDELIAQISQIREVGATEQLSETLESVLLGQNIASATSLIGADVVALNDQGQRVSGNVRVISITDGQPRLDLALATEPSAPEGTEGDVEEGIFDYEVVWQDEQTGEFFGIEVLDVNTTTFENFQGAIQLNNLPPTDTPKQIFRSDRSGEGGRRLVGQLPGNAVSFVDTTADDARIGNPIDFLVNRVQFARRETVSLNNVGEIRPPQS